MVQIIGFFPAAQTTSRNGWSNQDLGELYRVEGALLQAGLRIETESGVSDEGDPWFVFCHGDNGELIVHFARIDGRYVVAAPALPRPLRGADLGSIVRQFITENPVSLPVPEANRRGNVLFHPAALLTIFVATILIMSSPSEGLAAGAEETSGDGETVPQAVPHFLPDGPVEDVSKQRAGESAMLLIAAAIATEMARHQEDDTAGTATAAAGRNASLAHSFGQEGETAASAHDLFGLSDAYFVPGHETGDEQVLTADPEDEIVLPDGFALMIQVGGAGEHQIALSLPDDETPSLPAERPVAEQGAVATLEPVVRGRQEKAPAEPPAQEPVQAILQHEPPGTARGWIEEKAEAEGLKVKVLTAEQASGIADIVDMDVLVETTDAGAPATTTAPHPAFDEAAKQAVLYFLDSDDDIAIVGNAYGSIVIFDQSDLASGEPLTFRIWVYDETTTISIVGHSDTIADAMGLVA